MPRAAIPPGRLVYSTESAGTCPQCGWPVKSCRCAGAVAEEAVPTKIVAKLRIEKSGRGGKTVTVVDGLPRNRDFLKTLAGELKKSLGTGGSTGETTVEIQGDRREEIRGLLTKKGWTVKG